MILRKAEIAIYELVAIAGSKESILVAIIGSTLCVTNATIAFAKIKTISKTLLRTF